MAGCTFISSEVRCISNSHGYGKGPGAVKVSRETRRGP